MIRPIHVILLVGSLLTNPVQNVDVMEGVPEAAGLVGCKREAPNVMLWRCPEQPRPFRTPKPPLLQWHQTAPLMRDDFLARHH